MRMLDRSKTALVVIDLQKGILARPLRPYDAADVLKKSAKLAEHFREAGALVVLVTVDWHPGFPDALNQPVDEPVQRSTDGPPADFAAIDPTLGAVDGDLRVVKRQWSGFHGTELDLQFRRRGIDTIVLCGVATNLGVESTARAAWEHGYAVIFAENAVSSFSDDMHQFAFSHIFPRIGCVGSVESIVASLPSNQE